MNEMCFVQMNLIEFVDLGILDILKWIMCYG